MKVIHPTDPSRSKDIPDHLVEKYLAGGWSKVEAPKAPAKKAAAKPSEK